MSYVYLGIPRDLAGVYIGASFRSAWSAVLRELQLTTAQLAIFPVSFVSLGVLTTGFLGIQSRWICSSAV